MKFSMHIYHIHSENNEATVCSHTMSATATLDLMNRRAYTHSTIDRSFPLNMPLFGQLQKLCRALICFGSTLAFTSPLRSTHAQQRMSVAIVSSLRMKVDDIPIIVIPADIPLVRLLLISDTHGMEERLFDDDGIPVNIDLILHCGDWWSARGSRDRFDRLLAKWSHTLSTNGNCCTPSPMMIVVRGNHDPGKYKFSLSNAMYVTQPTRLDVYGLTMEIRPYDTYGVLCDDADILVSHEPPRGLLDQVSSGEHVGCTRLLTSVQESPTRPKVWCFGHIHEARGVMLHRFDADATEPTVLVNAACENAYRTKEVKSGPVILNIGKE